MNITKFDGEYRFLSNFYLARAAFEGVWYVSAEHAYQAAKSLDPVVRLEFRDPNLSAGQAKRRGKTISLRLDWEDVKISIMEEIVYSKFSSNVFLKSQLIKTAPFTLEEGNTWGDVFWGICHGVGQNHLGEILMGVRQGFIS